jgi:MoxR-like ATPase
MSLHASFQNIRQYLQGRILGQQHLIDRLLIALLSDGHLLVEGAPGLAKTKAIRELSTVIEGDFQRIQFTPDLLPADITGSDIYRPENGSFSFQKGPLFHNLILADEINRAPAKVQSALLEAMAERQISVGNHTYPLPVLFMVMATQNPIEQEGTYPLPEAQLDRFLMQVNVDYPDAASEKAILQLVRNEVSHEPPIPRPEKLSEQHIQLARQEILKLHMADSVEEYIVQLTLATRQPQILSRQLAQYLEYGVSPRATIAMDRCARARAWLNNKDYVSPDDVQAIAADCLRHRLLLSYEAEADGISKDHMVQLLLGQVPVA